MNAEQLRLQEAREQKVRWRKWGPYLSERQWGTVREDYSANGDAWDFFPHDHARSRAYRWGEDGIAGICDDKQRLCLALALWNGRDPILKERLFGLTNSEGNHGEDVKELYYYLDATPTHSYLKMLYKYPQREFPYDQLVDENHRRARDKPEYELLDTGIFDDDRYFDVFVEYAKAAADDLLMLVTIHNRGPEASEIHVLPQLWFRNVWSWGRGDRPSMALTAEGTLQAVHAVLGRYVLHADGAPTLLFCDNETNSQRLFGLNGVQGHFKDAFHDFVIHGLHDAVNPARTGTKAAVYYRLPVPAGGSCLLRLRLTNDPQAAPFAAFDRILQERRADADAFYDELQNGLDDPDSRRIQRQAFAGMIWSKQSYHYDVPEWLNGDPGQPPPPPARRHGRNRDWLHVNNADVISMPDKWEYPWYAAWDLAFHCIPFALIDAEFAKNQLVLLTREWYMHANGQLPAYEWEFGDVNPPVHAWASWRVFQIDRKRHGGCGDLAFLERVFHKLMLNFTWWVNRKDLQGRNIFQGGFLGLDNIGVFDRSRPLPTGGSINQADGTSWMAMYCLNLMRIALELALHNHVYEDIATKFFEHFLQIAEAMNNIGGDGDGVGLWDEEDQFYYDQLNLPDGRMETLKARSMIGLIPLFAVEILEPELIKQMPGFNRRLTWFLKYRPDLAQLVSRWEEPGRGERRLLSLLRGHRMKMLLKRMLDETEFLSDFGVRSMSKVHRDRPYVFRTLGQDLSVKYEPAESTSGMFGGNSNWRGPIWFPVNFLIIESLQKFHHYYGDDFKIECPTGSGQFVTICQVANELATRLTRLFRRDEHGRRAVFGDNAKLQSDAHFRDYLPFYEYFHGDNGRGVGAAHQTGWTGLIAKLLQPRKEETPDERCCRIVGRSVRPLMDVS
jgi:Mannosylglycerate hydrolase MGH1-like glycoside hydrolase domain/Glycosyl hydrolase family 63 C-terminal domain